MAGKRGNALASCTHSWTIESVRIPQFLGLGESCTGFYMRPNALEFSQTGGLDPSKIIYTHTLLVQHKLLLQFSCAQTMWPPQQICPGPKHWPLQTWAVGQQAPSMHWPSGQPHDDPQTWSAGRYIDSCAL